MNRCVCRRHPRSPLLLLLVLGAMLLGLAACAGVSPPRSVPPEPSRTPEEVLAALHAREAGIDSLKGLFQADIRGAYLPFSRRIHGTLFYQRPHLIRVTGLTRAGGMVFDFLLREQSYTLRVADRRDVMVGRVADLHRLGDVGLPIRLSLRAVELLLGKSLEASPSPEIRVEGDAYRYIVSPAAFPSATVPDGRHDLFGGRQHVWVDRYSAHIRAVEFRTLEEETRLALSASDFRPVPDGHNGDGSREHRQGSHEQAGALALPFVIHATDSATSGSVELSFLELAANVFLPERAFRVR